MLQQPRYSAFCANQGETRPESIVSREDVPHHIPRQGKETLLFGFPFVDYTTTTTLCVMLLVCTTAVQPALSSSLSHFPREECGGKLSGTRASLAAFMSLSHDRRKRGVSHVLRSRRPADGGQRPRPENTRASTHTKSVHTGSQGEKRA